jgi:hypothetical protein
VPRISEGQYALGALTIFAVWVFFVLPFLYGPPPRLAETRSPPQAHSEQTDSKPGTEPRGSADAPFFVQVVPAPKTAEERAQEAQDRQEKSSTDWWLMVFTGAVALFTLMLVGATALLYRAGERQLAHLDRTAKRELRAYVFVDTVHIKHILDGNGVPEAVVRVKNFGQTPAYEACAVTGFAVSTHPPPQGLLTISDEALAESKTRSSMGPGQTEIVIASPRPQLNRPLTDQERYEVGSGGATIYVYGRLVTVISLGTLNGLISVSW